MKKFKGFTLLELIVVMAIFSMIAVGALAIVQPAMRLFSSTSQQEEISACTDNMKRYIEDNLRYADKLVNCVGFEKLEDIYIKDTYNYVYFDDTEKATKSEERASDDSPVHVLSYFRDVYYPYVNSDKGVGYDTVYIMEVDSGTPTAPKGNVRIYKANLDTGAYTLDSELNTEFYNDYAYNVNFGVKTDDKYSGLNTAMDEVYIDVFKKDGTSFEDFGVALDSGHDATSALNLMNIHGLTTNVTIGYDDGLPVVNSGVTRLTTIINDDDDTYNSKYYFIYTVPEIIITD